MTFRKLDDNSLLTYIFDNTTSNVITWTAHSYNSTLRTYQAIHDNIRITMYISQSKYSMHRICRMTLGGYTLYDNTVEIPFLYDVTYVIDKSYDDANLELNRNTINNIIDAIETQIPEPTDPIWIAINNILITWI